ncbi:MAG TPA: isochorismatase family protein [Phycisphaerae bacterium]|nr:isochorismatase family protein [Phycisphaerae bacterium]
MLPCVYVDVNTQKDFLTERAACPVQNRDVLVPALRRAVAWAKRNHVPVISSLDCHRRGELRNARLPQHCLDGTPGQDKIDFTLCGSYVRIEGDNTLAVPIDLFRRYQQVIFRKRTADFFLNPKADRFISQLPAAEYVIAGLGVEGAVKAIALGLIARDKKVTIVVDACGYFDRSEAELAIRLLAAKGAELITVDQLMQRKLPRPIRYPRVQRNGNGVAQHKRITLEAIRRTETGGNGQVATPPC